MGIFGGILGRATLPVLLSKGFSKERDIPMDQEDLLRISISLNLPEASFEESPLLIKKKTGTITGQE